MLTKRFADPQMVLRELMDAMLSAPPSQPGNNNSLRRLLNVFTEKFEGIRNAGVDTGYFFLAHILFRKLDGEARRAWEVHQTAELRWKRLKAGANITPDPLNGAPQQLGQGKFDAEFGELMQFLHDRVQSIDRAGKVFDAKRTGPVQTKVSGGACVSQEDTPHTSTSDDLDSPTAGDVSSTGIPSQAPTSGPRFMTCPQCNEKCHTHISKCPEFLELDVESRYDKVRELNVCFSCLSQGHRISTCKSTAGCRVCKKRNHHTLLHRETTTPGAAGAVLEEDYIVAAGAVVVAESRPDPDATNNQDGATANESGAAEAVFNKRTGPVRLADYALPASQAAKGSVVYLCTIQVPILNAYGGTTMLRAMLDTGSQVDIISKSAADKLGWEVAEHKKVSIRGVGSGVPRNTHGVTTVQILLPGGKKYKLTCHVIDGLMGELATIRLPPSVLKKFDGYTLADPHFYSASQVDIIIGMAHYHDFVLTERVPIDHMWLVHTVMGWAVTGKLNKGNHVDPTPSVFTVCAVTAKSHTSSENLWHS